MPRSNTNRNALDRLREKPQAPVDIIPLAREGESERAQREAAKKSQRAEYDRAHPVSAYYIPPALKETAQNVHTSVRGLAVRNSTTASSVAGALLTHALLLVRQGKLEISGRPSAHHRKMIVHVEVIAGGGWGTDIPKEAASKPGGKPLPFYFGYRLSNDIRTQLGALAGSSHLVGEVIVFLLERALDELQRGHIKLGTEAVEVRQKAIVQG